MIKSLYILVILAKCDDKIVKQSLCEKEVITRLATFLNQNQEQALLKTIEIFRYLSTEPNLQPHLDEFVVIPKALTLLKKDLPSQGPMIADIQELSFIQQNLITINKKNYVFMKVFLLLLELFKLPSDQDNHIFCSLATSSKRCKQKLQENGGISIYVGLLHFEQMYKVIFTIYIKKHIKYQIENTQQQKLKLQQQIQILQNYLIQLLNQQNLIKLNVFLSAKILRFLLPILKITQFPCIQHQSKYYQKNLDLVYCLGNKYWNS